MKEAIAIMVVALCAVLNFIGNVVCVILLLALNGDRFEFDAQLATGFRGLRALILNHSFGKEVAIKFMYIVKDNNPDVGYSIEVGEVKDAEGNVIPDAQLSVEVASDNPAAVAVNPGSDPKSGTISFGAPGNATVTASVKSGDTVLGQGTASFLVTAGDPASISGVNLKFDGLTEATS